MRLLIQRVRSASVRTDGKTVAAIDHGLLVLAGFGVQEATAVKDVDGAMARSHRQALEKTLSLRVFPDEEGKMNRSLVEAAGSLLLVPQFTLYADTRKGRRPSFHLACHPESAIILYNRLCSEARNLLGHDVPSGVFGADMDVDLVNWGPVTMMIESEHFLHQRPACLSG